MVEVKVKGTDLEAAARQGMDEFIQVFVDAIHEAIGGQLSADNMGELNADQITLLAYVALRDEVMDGGFVQLIHNGLGGFIFHNPFGKAVRAWGLQDLYRIIQKCHGLYKQYHEQIEQDVAAHRADRRFRQLPDVGAENMRKLFHDERIAQTVDALRSIRELCDAHDIELTVFINPIYELTYLTNDLAQFDAFKRELATVVSYYDFSGINHVTVDPYYFYEASHYRPLTGDRMLACMMDGAPADRDRFGFFVTGENVERHLTDQQMRTAEWRERHAGKN